MQLGALAYGLYTVAAARPVALVFEIDQFRLVSASDLESSQLKEAPASLQALPWDGPKVLAAVKPKDPRELLETLELGLAGVHLAALPRYWREYGSEQARAWERGQALAETLAAHPKLQDRFNALAQTAGMAPVQLRTLPLLARKSEGFVLLAPPNGRVVGAVSLNERP